MDKSVLLEKRKNLFNLNRSSKELYLNSDFIDLYDLAEPDKLHHFFLDAKQPQLILNRTDIGTNIKDLIINVQNNIDMQSVFNQLNVNYITIPPFTTIEKFIEFKNTCIKKITEQKFWLVNQLLRLNIEAESKYYEDSIWSLHLSFGSLEGISCSPGNMDYALKSPLLNIKIRVDLLPGGGLSISKLNDGAIYLNEILHITLDDHYNFQGNLSNYRQAHVIETPFDSNKYFEFIKSLIPTSSIEENFSFYKKTNKDVLIKESADKLLIKKTMVISLVNPLGGKLLKDYDHLLNVNYEFPVVNSIFNENSNEIIYQEDAVYEINNPLNLQQKMAVVNSVDGNVFIYGPPGTGKSEVIANIIVNQIIRGRKTLVISEKKAALDVIDERLRCLKNISMSAFDNNYRDQFFQRIIDLNKIIITSQNVSLSSKDESYEKIIIYCKHILNLNKYRDLSNNSIYHFLNNFSNVDEGKYIQNKEIIRIMFTLVKSSNSSLEDIVSNLTNLKEVLQDFKDLIEQSFIINTKIFNNELIQECLDAVSESKEGHINNIILSFLETGIVSSKKKLFSKKYKIEESFNQPKALNIFKRIIEQNIYFVESSELIFHFISNNQNYVSYIETYDWILNTDFISFKKLLDVNATLNTIVHNYWKNKKIVINKFDKLVLEHYALTLKNKLRGNQELETGWCELLRKANLQRKPSINRIIKEHYSVLKEVFPVWILSPDSAASIVPLKEKEFDVGIFDEASQLRVERGLPLIFRCERSIVSGDDKQLRPSNSFMQSVNLNELYEGHLDNVESLLDKAKTSNWATYMLSNHYRSINEELICFSNKFFYENNLLCVTKNGSFEKSIELYDCMTQYNRLKGINEGEANKVMQILVSSIEEFKSIIVVTFNMSQAEHITNLISENFKLADKIQNKTLKIRSIENVQGDEADLVIISATFGMDNEGKFIQNFGPINQFGGKNRINVMITRAKEKMIIVKSFMSADLKLNKNDNIDVFKKFLSFVEQLQNNDPNALISNFSVSKENEEVKIASPNIKIIKNAIASLLTECQNLHLESNKVIGTHKTDLAVFNKETNKIKLLIFIDDINNINDYNTNSRLLIQNIDKQKYFQDRGYSTFRINEIEWLLSPNQIINNIKHLLII